MASKPRDPHMHEVLYALYLMFIKKGCPVAAFNTFSYTKWYESDLLAITKTGFSHEVEIKRTKSDYQADFIKSKKGYHKRKMSEAQKAIMLPEDTLKHDQIKAGELANHFWFACPAGLIDPKEIPEYAGLIYFDATTTRRCRVWVVKAAPKIHKGKTTLEMENRVLRSMMHRAWKPQEKAYRDYKKKKK